MLTFTRKEGESFELFIGDRAIALITIRRIQGPRARVSIAAPQDVEILRSENIDKERDKNAAPTDTTLQQIAAAAAVRRRSKPRRSKSSANRGDVR
jgi:sRNA-binding carbon storage regulator CsrA